MRNNLNYFTDIEARFQERRGKLLMLSVLDWSLMETWRDAGVPLVAVLSGIDKAFDRVPASRRIGVEGLAWCAKSVMEEMERLMAAHQPGVDWFDLLDGIDA